jgi:hypothetical protein
MQNQVKEVSRGFLSLYLILGKWVDGIAKILEVFVGQLDQPLIEVSMVR